MDGRRMTEEQFKVFVNEVYARGYEIGYEDRQESDVYTDSVDQHTMDMAWEHYVDKVGPFPEEN